MTNESPLLAMRDITKRFPGVLALDKVSFDVNAGEVHALVGENGAGKSTLMNVLSGVYAADEGTIFWRGNPVAIDSPATATALGIAVIHQELALIPALTVGQNIYLGREPRGALPGTIDWNRLYADAGEQLERLNVAISPRTRVAELSIAQQQMVEISKALSLNADVIVMDEPTSALTERETEQLFERIRALRSQGKAIVYISHRMEEVFEIADRVTVLRDGRHVGTAPITAVSESDIVRMMVGRDLVNMYARESRAPTGSAAVLSVRGLGLAPGETGQPGLHDISFDLHSGEILGVAGLMGAGRTNLAETLFGVTPATAGTISIEGKPVRIDSPQRAIDLGIGFVPEDRKAQGLFLTMAVSRNIAMPVLKRYSAAGFLRFGAIRERASEAVAQLGIRTPSIDQPVQYLSGGNQQKVVIAKWLTLRPRILILDEPTRGIDVGAKAEIHHLIAELARQGMAILMISSELPEVLGVSDRILVMREGRLAGELPGHSATQDAIMALATGTAVERAA